MQSLWPRVGLERRAKRHRIIQPLSIWVSLRQRAPATVDRDWPYQVALPASASRNGGFVAIREFCKDLSLRPRGHSVFHGDEWWNIYCFTEAAHAERSLIRDSEGKGAIGHGSRNKRLGSRNYSVRSATVVLE